jgi:hypothetical protein
MARGFLPASQQGILQTLVSFPISAAFPELAEGFCNCRQQTLCALDILSLKNFSLHSKLLTASVKDMPQNKEKYLTRVTTTKPQVTLQRDRGDRTGAGGENKSVILFSIKLEIDALSTFINQMEFQSGSLQVDTASVQCTPPATFNESIEEKVLDIRQELIAAGLIRQ